MSITVARKKPTTFSMRGENTAEGDTFLVWLGNREHLLYRAGDVVVCLDDPSYVWHDLSTTFDVIRRVNVSIELEEP